ncbi:MAG: hypothetical protein FD180_3310 [Planctomycetota bacterium]|nr:MAG: hypothetical protein FD180_3310 [Planctomycetota bacterium]
MVLRPGTIIKSLMVFSVGVAVGAAGGALVYKKLHPMTSQQAEASRPPASRTLAPPALTVAVASPASPNEAPLEVAVEKSLQAVASNPAVVVTPEPVDAVASKPAEVAASNPPVPTPVVPPAVQEFFGVPVGVVAGAPASAPTSGLLRLRLMPDRCVAGFDAKTSVVDFSGWTKALTGELAYEAGRPVESARGSVTADATTMDTGDADRDKELREDHLEAAKFPHMKFEISVVKMTSPGTVDMSGSMEIHGVRKDVTIPCTFKLRLDGFAYVAGEVKVKMTDFGIKPPTKLGIIKVEDEFRIWFEIWAEPVKEPAK